MLQMLKLKRKIAGSDLLPETNLSSASFNPRHPLVAVALNHKLYVMAYGGEARRVRGQIILAITLENPLVRFRNYNWSPSGEYLLCLEEDKEYFPSITLHTNYLKIYFYNVQNFSMNEIRFNEPLLPNPTMNTKYLWLDEFSFIFGEQKKNIFRIVNLKTDEKTYSEKKIDLSKTLDPLTKNTARKNFVSFVSSLFVLPDPSSPYLFFLTTCHFDHQHQRLVYVDKITHKIAKIASLPGEVVEISVNSENFFLLLQNRSYEDYKFNAPIVWNVSEKDDLQKCYFSSPWIGKAPQIDNIMTTSYLFRGDSLSIVPFRSSCCNSILKTENFIKRNTNSSVETLFPYLTGISRGNSLHTTKDYVYFVKKIEEVTQVFGLHHHFEFSTVLKDEFVFPPSNFPVYFHPSKPIFIRKKDRRYFDIYLLPWATDDDLKTYPTLDEDEILSYNEEIDFKKI